MIEAGLGKVAAALGADRATLWKRSEGKAEFRKSGDLRSIAVVDAR